MFYWIDGKPKVLSFNEVENKYHQAFVARFGAISITAWRGSYEYQASYPAIQMSVETGALTYDALQSAMESIANINKAIERPAVLASKVGAKFAEYGYTVYNQRVNLETKGQMRVSIDYEQTPERDREIAMILGKYCLPAGIVMIGDVSQVYSTEFGQAVDVAWSLAVKSEVKFKITVERSNNSDYAEDTTYTIKEKFEANWAKYYSLGFDIEPNKYLQIGRDLPWCSSIKIEYSFDDGDTWTSEVHESEYTDLFQPKLDLSDVVIL